MFQSFAISSQRPKCANLAQAGTNANETAGNRPVNLDFGFNLDLYLDLTFASDFGFDSAKFGLRF